MAFIDAGTCMVCKQRAVVEVTEEELVAYQNKGNRYVQDVLPRLSDGEREMLISGTHDECFDRLYGEPEVGHEFMEDE